MLFFVSSADNPAYKKRIKIKLNKYRRKKNAYI